MSDDIVTRLRMSADLMQGFPHMKAQHFNAEWVIEAADEIEDLRADRDRWAKWGEHVFTCPNKGINPCYDCVSPLTRDAMSRVDRGGKW